VTRTTADHHPSLVNPPCDFIAGEFVQARDGAEIRSHNPARPDRTIWAGRSSVQHAEDAVAAARRALPDWLAWPAEKRFGALRVFQSLAKDRAEALAALIRDEVGKPLWEAKQEAGAIAAKVDITLSAEPPHGPLERVSGYDIPLSETRIGRAQFLPHGVMAVLGPFNFPAHLPNGHIVPALAMGNTVVFKPSDKTPATGQMLAELLLEAMKEAGAPAGVVNLVQGGADVAQRLVAHQGVNGILFTGSWPVGRKILEANLDTPGRIVALELGGNNPSVVCADADLKQAVIECARASFATAGQRCTCTRRIIVEEKIADRFIAAFCKAASALVVGDPAAEHPVFCGPVIRESARKSAIDFVSDVEKAGGRVLVHPSTPEIPGVEEGHFITPGVIQVDRFTFEDGPGRDAGCDIEIFGPLVRLCVVPDFDEALRQANTTRYGLAASIFSHDEQKIRRFLREAQAGCVNVNTGTAGASGKLPFGGLGLSGNHRPAGAFSLDYCAYPVASMIESGSDAALGPGMDFDDAWL